MNLNQLSPKIGSNKVKTRAGRGIGSGKGKTCGRGIKGQKSRKGVSLNGFEGGQTPLHRRLPKIGFNNYNRKIYTELNLKHLLASVDKLDLKQEITEDILILNKIVRRKKDGIKLIGNIKLDKKFKLLVSKASSKAKEQIEKAGGEVTFINKERAKIVNKKKLNKN